MKKISVGEPSETMFLAFAKSELSEMDNVKVESVSCSLENNETVYHISVLFFQGDDILVVSASELMGWIFSTLKSMHPFHS